MNATRLTDPAAHRPLPRPLVVLVGFIALVEIVLTLADLGVLGDQSLRVRVFQVGAFWPPLVHGARPIFELQPLTMFLTHALLHGSFLHMAMNMAVLLGLGRFTADRYGANTILPVFLVCAVAGALTYGLLSRSPAPMIGASGAVFGFLGVWIAWDWYRHKAQGTSTEPVVRRVIGLAVINVLFFFGLDGMLAWQAHLGGFVAGLACGAWLESRQAAARRRVRAAERVRGQGGGSA